MYPAGIFISARSAEARSGSINRYSWAASSAAPESNRKLGLRQQMCGPGGNRRNDYIPSLPAARYPTDENQSSWSTRCAPCSRSRLRTAQAFRWTATRNGFPTRRASSRGHIRPRCRWITSSSPPGVRKNCPGHVGVHCVRPARWSVVNCLSGGCRREVLPAPI